MDRESFIQLISRKMRLIRVERGYSQEKMASIIGISKKTLVEIEKERILAGWTTVIAVCTLFRESEILQATIGDDPIEIVETLAHEEIMLPKQKSMGGRIWWRDVEERGIFRLQQNMFSQHYRILDEDDYRWYSSFDEAEAKKRLQELAQNIH